MYAGNNQNQGQTQHLSSALYEVFDRRKLIDSSLDKKSQVQELLKKYGKDRYKYIKFLLYPDVFPPVRPPQIFPFPTHIFKQVSTYNLTPTGGALYFVWQPFNTQDADSDVVYWDGGDTIGTPPGTIATVVTGETSDSIPAPTITGMDQEGVNGIAACLKLTYVGSIELAAGQIEIGVFPEDNQSTSVDYLTVAQIKNSSYYQKYNITQGVRCVWLPLGQNQLNISSTNENINMAYYIFVTGAAATSQSIRVDVEYYYHGWVDYDGYNTLLPKHPPKYLAPNHEVLNVLSNVKESHAIQPNNQDSSGAINYLKGKLSQIGDMVTGGIGSYISNEMLPGIGAINMFK